MTLVVALAVLCVSGALVAREILAPAKVATGEPAFLTALDQEDPAEELAFSSTDVAEHTPARSHGARRSPEAALARRRAVATGKDAQLRWWQRIRALLELAALVVALGVGVALAIGGGILVGYFVLDQLVG